MLTLPPDPGNDQDAQQMITRIVRGEVLPLDTPQLPHAPKFPLPRIKIEEVPDKTPLAVPPLPDHEKREAIFRFFYGLTVLIVLVGIAVGAIYLFSHQRASTAVLSQDEINQICTDAPSPSTQEVSHAIISYSGFISTSDNSSVQDAPYQKVLKTKYYRGTDSQSICAMWINAVIQTSKGQVIRAFRFYYFVNETGRYWEIEAEWTTDKL